MNAPGEIPGAFCIEKSSMQTIIAKYSKIIQNTPLDNFSTLVYSVLSTQSERVLNRKEDVHGTD